MYVVDCSTFGMQACCIREFAIYHLEPGSRGKQCAESLICETPVVGRLLVQRKAKVGLMKGHPAHAKYFVDFERDCPRHRDVLQNGEGENGIELSLEVGG